MQRIQRPEQEIRRFVNEEYKREPGDWQRWISLCVAMDTLGDTALALLEFEERGMGRDYGERYLRLYGLLQAIILQQDAILMLSRVLCGMSVDFRSSGDWARVRTIRHLSAGHPVENRTAEKGSIKHVMVSRVTVSDKGMTLLVWDEKTEEPTVESVDLAAVYEGYKLDAISRLETISNQARILAAKNV